MPKRLVIGRVTSDRVAKTRRVEIARFVQHAKYTKIIRRKTVCHVHDEQEISHVGDLVEIEESVPLSKLKRWTMVRVVEKSREVDLAALRAARRGGANEQQETLAVLSDGSANA